MKRRPLACAGSLALCLAACTAILDLNDYEFADGGAAGQQTPALPPEPERDAGMKDASVAPARDAALPPVSRPGNPLLPEGGAPDAGPPPVEPPPVEPAPRPVVVDDPEPLALLSGSPTGGQPRAGNCPGGVMYGLVFQYYTSIALAPDRLSYVWPLCNRLEPGTPSLTDGEVTEVNWIVSSPNDPVFAPLRENEGIDAIACPIGLYVVGIEGTYDEPVGPSVGFRGLAIRCAPLNTDAESSTVVHGLSALTAASGISPVPGALPFVQACPEGRAANQLELRFGDWLDAIGLRCSAVRWPFTAGHACATDSECQSGACGLDGTCVP